MLSKREIKITLDEINDLYNNSRGTKKPQFYSMLALIEASGWVEKCIDKIVTEISSANLNTSNNTDFINNTLKKTNGFRYDDHIRNRLLKNLIGLALIEKIESILNSNADFIQMKSSLGTLNQRRNENAHDYISGATPTIIAPSVTMRLFDEIYDGLKILRSQLKKIKFK